MAPLDAIAQAAGRCDREGRETARLGRPGGRVIVFEPDVPPDKALPRGEYEEATPITRAMAETGDLSIDNPDHVRAFFSRYYGGADLDPRNIQALRSQLDFPAVWEQFELIERDTRAVLVPYDATAQNLIRRLTFAGGESAELLRHLQRYQVGLRPWVFAKARDMHAVYEIGKDSDVWVCGNNFYSKEMGFHLGGGEILIA
jgi:CRISPR-associated endonuclease/helicase Cas3